MAEEVLRRDEGEMRDEGLVGRVGGEEAMAIVAPLIVLFHDS